MIYVYGVSDDLIEVRGEIDEEFYANSGEANKLVLSDGVLVELTHDDRWNINVLSEGNNLLRDSVEVEEGPSGGIGNEHSDLLVVDPENNIRWVATVDEFKRAEEG